MKIDLFVLGDYETNCYLLCEDASAKDCLIIDTGLEAGRMVDFLAAAALNPLAVVLTHGHADHIGGLARIRSRYPSVKVYIHKLDADMLAEPARNLSRLTGQHFTAAADVLLENGDTISQAGISLAVLHTPGHTPGGICLYSKQEKKVFVGDTLFAGSVGRTDFPGGNMEQLMASIREKLLSLPDKTAVYPGHGPATTIGRERAHNQCLQ